MEITISLKGNYPPQKYEKANKTLRNPAKTKNIPRALTVTCWIFWINCSFAVPQAEDQALLPEGDEPIDQRQWTQQHLEAADVCGSTSLALTPPQADQEVDVLDVNVRGPGQYSMSVCPASQAPTSPVSSGWGCWCYKLNGVCRNTSRNFMVLKESTVCTPWEKKSQKG